MACPLKLTNFIVINVEALGNVSSGVDQILSRFWMVLADCNCDEEQFVVVVTVGIVVCCCC